MGAPETLHATAIVAAGRAALIRGPSGSGKSDLALRCLALAPSPLIPSPTHLVSDDQVCVSIDGDAVMLSPPAAIAGLLEVRGIGIIRVPEAATGNWPLHLVVDLVAEGVSIERLPDPWPTTLIQGRPVRLLRLRPFEPSAPAKLLMALMIDGPHPG